MKNKLMKKTIAAVFALSLLSGSLPIDLGRYSLNENAIVSDAAAPSAVLDEDGTLTLSGTFEPKHYGIIRQYSDNDAVKKVVCKDGTVFKKGSNALFYKFKATEMDLSNVTWDNLMHMDYMFFGCSNLTKVDLSGIDTSNVIYMESMFSGCSSLTSIDVSGFDTSNVTSMKSVFSGCSSLTSIDVSGFDISNVNDTSFMFDECYALKSVDVSGFDTSNVKDMEYMFSECKSLTSLDVSGFDTSNVYLMNLMFFGCSSLTSLDVSGFDTSNVTGMSWMFCGCDSLTSLDVSGFDTSNVTDMSCMFGDCSGLTELDLSSFDTKKVENTKHMFNGCNELKTIFVSDKWDMSSVISSGAMFGECYNLVGGNGTAYDGNKIDAEYARIDKEGQKGYLTEVIPSAILDEDGTLTISGTFSDDYSLIKGYSDNGGVKKVVCKKGTVFKGDCSGIFDKFEANEIDLSNVTWDNVTNMAGMFKYCNRLKSIDLSGIDTSKVTDMSCMFYCCFGLKSIDLTCFDTSKVTDMSCMFHACFSLKKIDVTGFDTSKVTNMSYMFHYCDSLTDIDVTGFNTSNVTDMSYMFGLLELKNIDVTGFDTSNVVNMSYMFGLCSNLTSIDVSGFDTSNVTDMSYMFVGCDELKNLDLTGFDTKKVENTTYMFANSDKLKTIFVSDKWDMSSVIDSESMFENSEMLVGGNGTAYDENKIDAEYARIDKEGQKGYLTKEPVRLSEPKYKQTTDKDGIHYVRYVFVVPKSELDGKSKAVFTANYDGTEKELETNTYYTGMTTNGIYYRPDSANKVLFVVTITGVSAENESKLDCSITLE